MSKASERVINWRRRLKQKSIAALGGCCQCCGYNKSINALEFHHLDPEQKEFSFSQLKVSPKKSQTIITELKKCVLVCANCHREIHDGITQLPKSYAKLDESCLVSEYELKKRCRQQTAVSIKKIKEEKIKIDRIKIKVSKIDLQDLLINTFNNNKSALARYLKVSETAIRKKLKT